MFVYDFGCLFYTSAVLFMITVICLYRSADIWMINFEYEKDTVNAGLFHERIFLVNPTDDPSLSTQAKLPDAEALA